MKIFPALVHSLLEILQNMEFVPDDLGVLAMLADAGTVSVVLIRGYHLDTRAGTWPKKLEKLIERSLFPRLAHPDDTSRCQVSHDGKKSLISVLISVTLFGPSIDLVDGDVSHVGDFIGAQHALHALEV